MHGISYFIFYVHCLIRNKGTVVTKYCLCLNDTMPLPSLPHTFTSHSNSAFMLYHISNCGYCLITNIDCCYKILSILHDPNIK